MNEYQSNTGNVIEVQQLEMFFAEVDAGLSMVSGPGDTSMICTTFISYLQHKLPVLPAKTAFSWAHVEDIARGHILTMELGTVGESHSIAGPTHTLVEGMQVA